MGNWTVKGSVTLGSLFTLSKIINTTLFMYTKGLFLSNIVHISV